jgi:spermidine/putrescine transport system substrate-binding protein
MMSLYNGNGAGLWDLDDAAWSAVQAKTTSLRPQVGGFFDYGGTFNGLKNGEMLAMCGIGDWITGVLEKDGAPVGSVIQKEGGIQFTESYSIGKGSDKGRNRQQIYSVYVVTSGSGKICTDGSLSRVLCNKRRPCCIDRGRSKRSHAFTPDGRHVQ